MNFNGTANELQNAKYYFEKTIAPLINLSASLPEDAEKVKLVHDYLTNTIQYVAGSPYNQSAYSAIVFGKTVCAGYAHAFQYCMQKLGIPAAYIVGYAGEAHAWNLLQLGDEYHCMDVTWDDPLGNPPTTYYYNYFNITDAQISKGHTSIPSSSSTPAPSYSSSSSTPSYSEPDYSYPDDDIGYIDDWSDDWDDWDYDDFYEQLAIMITENSAARKLIERALDAGNFIEKKNDLYSIHFQFRGALCSKAVKEFRKAS